MRRTLGVLAAAVTVVVGAAACGGGDDAGGTTTTAPNSITVPPVTGPDGSVVDTADAVGRYCAKVNERADLVAEGRNGSGDYDAQIRTLSDELKDLSTEAATSLPTNPTAAKKFAECSLEASGKIAEAFQPG